MKIGKLKKLITIQQNTPTRGTTGEPLASWAAYATNRWAEILPEAGDEGFSAQKITTQRQMTVRLRYIAGVTSAMRVVYGGENFNILTVVNTGEQNRELVLKCELVS